MSPAFRAALKRTLAYEGGLVDHPLDPGGRTYHGITQRTYDEWRRVHGLAVRPVEKMTATEEREIYHAQYWRPCYCDELPEAIAPLVFDMAVHSGPRNANLALQRAAGVKADGVVGPVTMAAAQTAQPLRFLLQRAAFLAAIVKRDPTQAAFLDGWMKRLLDQAERA